VYDTTANRSDLADGDLLIIFHKVKLIGNAFFTQPRNANVDLQFILKRHWT